MTLDNGNQFFFGFNTQPPEGGWASLMAFADGRLLFQHTAARRRLEPWPELRPIAIFVSTHSRPKAAGARLDHLSPVHLVSTHSRPKAAGTHHYQFWLLRESFNTQPPEGGWPVHYNVGDEIPEVSTHSRPKAAGLGMVSVKQRLTVSTHSRPKAAGQYGICRLPHQIVSTHSRPKAAGVGCLLVPFKHRVSTHSRPKAAGNVITVDERNHWRFNTQPPEGGWHGLTQQAVADITVSTHSRPKAAGF